MEKWFKTCLLLCLVGFLKQFRPNESFSVEYLVGPWQNFTNEEVLQLIYPVWTYTYAPMLIVVFLVTDYLLYKPVVVFGALCYSIYYVIYIWGHSLPAQQAAQAIYATGTASKVAYNTYIYTQCPKEKFQLATSYSQAAVQAGVALASLTGQILISTGLCDYATINYVSLAFVLAATIVACFLPSAKHSIYFHRGKSPVLLPNSNDPVVTATKEEDGLSPWRLLWTDFTSSYSNSYTVKWSIWWAFALCGSILVAINIQNLYDALREDLPESDSDVVLNGAVEFINSFLSFCAILAIGRARINWSVHGELVIALLSLFQGVLLFLAGTVKTLWVVYIVYILFGVSYQILIISASSEVAKGLKRESYGLVFGINTFLAVTLQAVMTIIFISPVGLALGVQLLYQVYGCYFGVLGLLFLVSAAYNKAKLLP